MEATATHLNIIDIFMAFVIAGVISWGAREGIITEIFKLLGVFCAIFVTLHYYAGFADFLKVQFFGEDVSTELFALTVLGVLTFVTFILISKGWVLILKIKIHEKIDRYGGIVLSLVESYFACGLIFFALLLANYDYVLTKTRQSMSRNIFGYVAVDFYRATYSNVIEKFFPSEKINEEAFKVITEKKKKKKKKR
ncbi:MAG: CvpA family protein [Candidatus Omnitrophica bacterium]|nr:CvpA family protein [Candidatus Omnitrophota bacterium]